jgi:hypothetical protein
MALEDFDWRSLVGSVASGLTAALSTGVLAKEGSSIAWGAPVVSVLIVGGFLCGLLMLYFRGNNLAPNVTNLLNTFFGTLILGIGQVCNYWLGSSAGSKKSGDAIRKSAEQVGGRG